MSIGERSTTEAGIVHAATGLHERVFASLEARLDGWFIGLCARALFVAVLLPYYINSALTKPGDGVFGIFTPAAGAFAQILPPIAEQYSYDTAAIPVVPWHLIVILGTVSEFVLPVLIALGLLTRLSALGMMGFIAVQTAVDIAFHGAAPGMLFNTQPLELLDQRALWLFPLLVLLVNGPGSVSANAWLRRRRLTTTPRK